MVDGSGVVQTLGLQDTTVQGLALLNSIPLIQAQTHTVLSLLQHAINHSMYNTIRSYTLFMQTLTQP